MLFFCAVLFFQLSPFCNGFLLTENKTSVSSHGRNSLNDEHYVYLMGLLSADRQNMAKMEKFVLPLQNDMNTMKHGYSTLKKELNQVKTDNEALKQEMTQLKQDNTKSEICTYRNETLDMKQVLDACTHSRSNNSMTLQQNIQELNNKTDKMSTQLNILTSTSQARGQDFIALLQETNTAKQQISILEREAKHISSDLQNYKSHTATKIEDVLHMMNQTVALTARIASGTISSIPKFSDIITSIGISDINGFKQSGKFTCEVAGVYLFTVFIIHMIMLDFICIKTVEC